ncbi:hypothetical protein, partial [Bacillus pumilus]|uniref:hypothetical protein n=1 Tax=Bacillus pumilus TaxID=1408 RepID=UPI001C9B7FDA
LTDRRRQRQMCIRDSSVTESLLSFSSLSQRETEELEKRKKTAFEESWAINIIARELSLIHI